MDNDLLKLIDELRTEDRLDYPAYVALHDGVSTLLEGERRADTLLAEANESITAYAEVERRLLAELAAFRKREALVQRLLAACGAYDELQPGTVLVDEAGCEAEAVRNFPLTPESKP